MHVRMFKGRLKPGARDEALQRFNEQILPLLQERENYNRCQVAVNADDEFVAILGFRADCGPPLLRQLYEEMSGKISDLLVDNLDHSLWEGLVDDATAPPKV